MIKLQNFSFLKPIIPRRIQILIRRALINQKLPQYKHIWPIDPNSAKPPEGWNGWPKGKKFALVLTHDVDTKKGHDKCHLLAKIEERLGFRSSFNFVAEDYQISRKLMQRLRDEGHEIGQHGINHVNPFRTKKYFLEQAENINKYLSKWNAVGFRSPSMYHNLDWLHDLKIEYDASTFDTDPFEPQPDGAGTIFPFWVSNSMNQNGYVELPYTLPQDFTLFILMKQKNIDIWTNKLDWIATHGGMALFITHPDYMNFSENECRHDEYPPKYYEDFLKYVNGNYKDEYWNVLPRNIANFWYTITPKQAPQNG